MFAVVWGEYATASSATIATDRLDYPPGDTVWITGSGFKANVPSLTGEIVELSVLHTGKSGLIKNEYGPWTAQADVDGNFTSFWVVPFNDSIVGATLELTATGLSSGLVATTQFTDANVILTLTTILPDTVCPGDSLLPGSDSLYLCAQLLQGGCDLPLANRPVIFYWNPGNCGVEDDAEGEDTVYTDANGYACTEMPIPDDLGTWVLRVKFEGEDKPNPCPSPGNSACDPNNANEAQRCVNLSASNICQSVTVDTVVCCTPPVCSLGTLTSLAGCTPDTDFVAFTSSDSDDGLEGCVLYGPGELVSGGWLYEPVGGETVNVRIVCTNLCGDSCVTEFSRTYNQRDQIACLVPSDTTITQCDPSEVALAAGAIGATCELVNNSPGALVNGNWVYTPSGDETVLVAIRCISTNACDTCFASFSVTFEVNTPPTITCPPDLTFECDSVGDFGWPTAEDDRELEPTIYILSRDSLVGDCQGAYTLQLRYVAKDSCGDSAYCTQMITVQDTQSPVLVGCPNDTTVHCGGIPDAANVTATDNCDASVVPVLTESEIPANCGTITRRWVVTDDCGNADTCTQHINVVDTTAPVVECAGDTTVYCSGGGIPSCFDDKPSGKSFEKFLCDFRIIDTVYDECDASIEYQFSLFYDYEQCPRYIRAKIWAVDSCGNTSDTCLWTVYFEDTSAPVIACPPNINAQCSSSPSTWGQPTATDDCGQPTIALIRVDTLTENACSLEVTRTWTATDFCGNADTCVQTIIVTDTVDPILVGCPNDTTVLCGDVPPVAIVTAYDNCDLSVTPVFSQTTPLDVCELIIRRWIATDDCGNADTCEQIITRQGLSGVCDTLCGTVYNTDCPGTTCLVADACVQLWDAYPDGSVISTDTTDASGNFCFDVLPGVEYDLRIYKQGFCTDVFLDSRCGDELILGLDSLDFEVPDSPLFHDFWSTNAMTEGHLILPGDVIYACDSNGLIVGVTYVKDSGEYLIHVSGNVPKGPPDLIDEGADPGEIVSLWLNCECPIQAPVGFVNFAETKFDAVFDCPTDTICDSLCGYVYDCDCDQKGVCGIDGVTVELWSSYPDGKIIDVDTAVWGAFCFDVLPGVEYDVRFWKKGYCTDTVSNWSCEYGPLQFCLKSLDFTLPESPLFHDYYSTNATFEGWPILPGDVIYACDSNGIIVGVAYVDQPGTYLIHVLGNVPKLNDSIDEGTDPGEKVSLWLNCECPVTVNEGFVNFGNTLFDAEWDCRVTGICCELCPGWNMFSYNVYLNDYSRENVLATIDLNYDAVRSGYCDEPTSPHLESWFANRPVNDLTEVNPWHGYDIYMTTADTLCLEGAIIPAETPIYLCAGWNYVPYFPMEADSREHALQSIAGNYTNVFNLWCDNFDSYNAARPDGANDLFCLSPCRGYWIKVNRDDTLIYPTDGYECSDAAPKLIPSYSSGSIKGSPVVADFWSNSGLNAGDIIEVYSESGMLIGEAQAGENGQFLLHVFGDVPSTSAVEGAQDGEELSFRVNGLAASVEGNTRFSDRENSQVTLHMSGANPIPDEYALLQNYPNPFNAGTVIPFTMKDASDWTLTVYNIMGQTVQTFAGYDAPGSVRVNWNGLDHNGATVPSGVYFYRVTTDSWSATRKMTILK